MTAAVAGRYLRLCLDTQTYAPCQTVARRAAGGGRRRRRRGRRRGRGFLCGVGNRRLGAAICPLVSVSCRAAGIGALAVVITGVITGLITNVITVLIAGLIAGLIAVVAAAAATA